MAIFEDIKRFFEPKPKVRARDILREIPGATVETGKDILRDFPRSITEAGLKLTGKKELVPESKVGKFLLGEKPVKAPEKPSEFLFTGLGVIPPILPVGKLKAVKPIAEATGMIGKEKKFLQTIQKSTQTTKELKAAIGEIDPLYRPITNRESIFKADQAIAKSSDVARTRVLSDEVVSAEKSALAIRLGKKYEAEGNIDSAVEVIESYDRQLRSAGQFIQAASLWNKLSPRALIRTVERTAEKQKVQLPLGLKETIVKAHAEIQKIPVGPEQDKATFELLNYVADQFPATKMELLDAYRYQNMLSSPRTQERNIEGNLFQTFVTRPTDLFAEALYGLFRHPFNPMARDIKFSDAPIYLKNVFTSFPNALIAFKEGFRSGRISEKIIEKRGETAIEALRQIKTPKALTVVPRFMEATDRFFGVLIGMGEKARLMARGTAEETAQINASTLAEQYLFRERLGKTQDPRLFVEALDGLGSLALKGRTVKGIGTVWSWFVPFVTTITNIAKEQVKRSPLGFVGKGLNDQQIALAISGTVVTGIGAVLAMQDRTSWLAPTDKKAKELWYASGKKPFAIQIGNKWVPMWYFGPYAMALAMPASLKYFQTETKTALTDNDFAKIGKAILGTSRFITSQTPLSGIEGFIKTIEGDIDYSLPSQLAFTAGQFIPFEGMIRYVNTWLDPVYRKSDGFIESFQKEIPFISKNLPAYADPSGDPAKRDTWNYFLPWDIGVGQVEFNAPLEARQRKLQAPKGGTFKVKPILEYR